jgi:fused signal recognition particle receptor
LEDILIEGDIGPANAAEIIDTARAEIRGREARDRDRFFELLKVQLGTKIRVEPLEPVAGTVNLILVLGVNGVGKTTTIAKLAHYFVEQRSKRVVLAAADTFRAAAIDQLLAWGKRLSLPVVRQDPGSDPAAVVFDALSSAEAAGADLVIADTAGRMHNKAHLVKELGKIDKIASRRLQPRAYRKVLVIDATTGQNALRQAEVFHEAVGVDAIIVAKYDSTAKGGIVVAIARELGIPFSFLGTGEKPDDLRRFTTQDYLNRLLEAQ